MLIIYIHKHNIYSIHKHNIKSIVKVIYMIFCIIGMSVCIL